MKPTKPKTRKPRPCVVQPRDEAAEQPYSTFKKLPEEDKSKIPKAFNADKVEDELFALEDVEDCKEDDFEEAKEDSYTTDMSMDYATEDTEDVSSAGEDNSLGTNMDWRVRARALKPPKPKPRFEGTPLQLEPDDDD